MTWSINPTITVAGVEYTNLTFNQVSIDYGRSKIFDTPRPGYARLEIANTTNSVYPFKINDTLVIELKNASGVDTTIFTGIITDVRGSFKNSDTAAGLGVISLTAVAPMAQMSRIVVGQTAYPSETDAARIQRIFTEAGVTVDVVDPAIYTFASRPAGLTDAFTLANNYASSVLGAIYETTDGKVGYANESRRNNEVNTYGYLTIPNSSIIINSISSNENIADVMNLANVTYSGGTASDYDTTSQSTYGIIGASFNTELSNLADAETIAATYINLRSLPRKNLSSFGIRLLDPTLSTSLVNSLLGVYFGMPVEVPGLPNSIVATDYQGYVEGWNLSFSPANAVLTLKTSEEAYSYRDMRWQDVDPTIQWEDIEPSVTTSTKTNLVTNPTFEPINYGKLGYVPMVNGIGNFTNIYVPDQASFDITGDFDLRVLVSLDDWTPGAQQTLICRDEGSVDRTWVLYMLTNGRPQFLWWDSGGTLRSATASINPTVADGAQLYIRVTLDVDNGAGGNSARFYSSTDGLNWTQIGTTQTQAFVTSIRATTAQITIGYAQNGYGIQGKFYKAELRNGIDGTVVFYTDIAGDWKSTDGFSYTTYSGQTASVMSRYAKVQSTGVQSVYLWAGNTGTALNNSTAQSYTGRGSLLMTVFSAGTSRGAFIPSGTRIPVTAGQTYTFTAYLRDGNSGLQWRNVLNWYTLVTGGSLTGSSTGVSTTVTSTGWTRLTVTGTAPAGTTAVSLFTNMPGSATLNTYAYIDAIQLESGSTASTYFDGYASDIPAKEYPVLAWTGTAQQSTSTAVAYWGTKPTTLWNNVDTQGIPQNRSIMATSPNYGWVEPNDTDYVKDGAEAMRDLGNSIDSTLNKIENFKGEIQHPFLLMGA